MTAPTVYYSYDAGAPVLGGKQDQFYQIFRACLVDGYGTKAAAGWSVVYDDWENSGWATFTNAGQSGVLGIVRAAASYQPFLFIADAMIDATTPVNARSGYSDIAAPWSPSDTANNYHRPVYPTVDISNWCVVANDNTAFLMCGPSSLFTYPSSAWGSNYGAHVAIGSFTDLRGLGSASNPLGGNFLIVGGSRYGYADHNSNSSKGYYGSHVTASRDIDNDYLSGTKYGVVAQFQYNVGYVPYWNVADSVVDLKLQSVDIAISTDTSSNWRTYLWQRATAKMMKASGIITGYSGWNSTRIILSRLGLSPLRDIIEIDSKDHILVFFPYGGAFFLSLASEDWL